MKSNVPWSVKGIAPDARTAAKQAAREANMTLGEWLNQTIHQMAEGGAALAADANAETSSNIVQAVPENVVTVDQLRELVNSLNRMNERLRTTEENSRSAAYGLNEGLTSVLERVKKIESTQTVTGDKALKERLDQLEKNGGGERDRIESLKSLENALRQIVHQFETTQTETIERVNSHENAIQSLTHQVEELDGQTAAAFKQVSEAVDAITTQVAQAEKSATAVMGEAREAAGSDDPEFVERTSKKLRILGNEIKRSGDQIQELESLIQKLSGKIEDSERRSAEGITKVSNTIELMREEINTIDSNGLEGGKEAMMAATRDADNRLNTLQKSFDLMVQRLDTVVERRAARLAAEKTVAEKTTKIDMTPQAAFDAPSTDAEFDEVFNDAKAEVPNDTVTQSSEKSAANIDDIKKSLSPKQKVILAARARRKRLEKQAAAENTIETEASMEDVAAAVEQASQDTLKADAELDLEARERKSLLSRAKDATEKAQNTEENQDHKERLAALRSRYEKGEGKGLPFYLLIGAGTILALVVIFFIIKSLFGGDDTPQSVAEPKVETTAPAPQVATYDAEPSAAPSPNTLTPQEEALVLYQDGVAFLRTAETEEVKKDAVERFRRAALLGHVPAKYQLGEMYLQGIGVTTNEANALLWYEEAANGGNVLAMHRLGVLLIESETEVGREQEALASFEKAASYGQSDSMFNLGFLYNPSEGQLQANLKDAQQSYYYYKQSEKMGDSEAGLLAQEIGVTLTNEQRAVVDAQIASWEPLPIIKEANDTVLLAQ